MKLASPNKDDFEKTYNRFFNVFYEVALQFLHNEEEAKEATQDAFVKLWEKKIFEKSDKEIKNYLFIVIRNNCLNILREKRKRLKENDSHNYLLASINYKLLEQTGEDILLHQELFDKIQAAISKLSPQCKEVFKLSRFEELSNKEIAHQLGISIKAVEANITRALKKLREDLAQYLSREEEGSTQKSIHSILLSFL